MTVKPLFNFRQPPLSLRLLSNQQSEMGTHCYRHSDVNRFLYSVHLDKSEIKKRSLWSSNRKKPGSREVIMNPSKHALKYIELVADDSCDPGGEHSSPNNMTQWKRHPLHQYCSSKDSLKRRGRLLVKYRRARLASAEFCWVTALRSRDQALFRILLRMDRQTYTKAGHLYQSIMSAPHISQWDFEKPALRHTWCQWQMTQHT